MSPKSSAVSDLFSEQCNMHILPVCFIKYGQVIEDLSKMFFKNNELRNLSAALINHWLI